MPLPITAIFAGLLALWLIFLQAKVIGFRRANLVSLGDGGHDDGKRLTRAHANAVENIPIFLILLGLSEGLGSPGWIVMSLGAAFLVGRILHGVHFFQARQGLVLRQWGMLLTLIAIALTALGAIGHGIAGLG